MKKSCVSVCLLFIGVFQLHAQRELLNPLVDSKLVREKGIALHEAGNAADFNKIVLVLEKKS